MERVEPELGAQSSSSKHSDDKDDFWGDFDSVAENQTSATSIEVEIQMWTRISRTRRTANPIAAMEALKSDFPRIYRMFRMYSIFPATQNKDERLFSLIAQNTGPLSRRIKVETIERKVVVGSAIQKHGFVFDFSSAPKANDNSESSDEADWCLRKRDLKANVGPKYFT